MALAFATQISLNEAFGIISQYQAKLLPGTSGVLYLFRNSRRPPGKGRSPGLAPVCGRRHSAACLLGAAPGPCSQHKSCQRTSLPHSRHVAGNGDCRLCLPRMAQDEVLGRIYTEVHQQEPDASMSGPDGRPEDLAVSISEPVAPALSNARLRQVPKEHSITEPLTGMFNRRYMGRPCAANWPAPSGRRRRFPSSCSTWITSGKSTTFTAMTPATACCRQSPAG